MSESVVLKYYSIATCPKCGRHIIIYSKDGYKCIGGMFDKCDFTWKHKDNYKYFKIEGKKYRTQKTFKAALDKMIKILKKNSVFHSSEE